MLLSLFRKIAPLIITKIGTPKRNSASHASAICHSLPVTGSTYHFCPALCSITTLKAAKMRSKS